MRRGGATTYRPTMPQRPRSGMCPDPGVDRVWIEIDPSAEPISGVVHQSSEPPRRFGGWLELVALLETGRRPGNRPIAPPDQG